MEILNAVEIPGPTDYEVTIRLTAAEMQNLRVELARGEILFPSAIQRLVGHVIQADFKRNS